MPIEDIEVIYATPTFQSALKGFLDGRVIELRQQLEETETLRDDLTTAQQQKDAVRAFLPKVWKPAIVPDFASVRASLPLIGFGHLPPKERTLCEFFLKNFKLGAAYIAELFQDDLVFGERLMGDTYLLVEFIAGTRGENLDRLNWLKEAQLRAASLETLRASMASLQAEMDSVKPEPPGWYRLSEQQEYSLLGFFSRRKKLQAAILILEDKLQGMEPAQVRAELEATYLRLAAIAGVALAAVTAANAETKPTVAAEVAEPLDSLATVDFAEDVQPRAETDDVPDTSRPDAAE